MSKTAWTTEEHVASHEGRLAIAEAKIELLVDKFVELCETVTEKLEQL